MTRPPTFVVVQHIASEGPGLIATVAHQHEVALDIRRMDRGDPLRKAGAMEGLIVLGGPMAAYETAAHPHLAAEQRLLESAVALGLPILGVCLGAQLLAAALGGRVFKGPGPEIGIGEVTLTAAGRDDPLLGPAGPAFSAFHWHGDTFELPAGAAHLASTAAYENQAYRVGDKAYALQFHVELDTALARDWKSALPPGVTIAEKQRAAVEATGRAILHRFFELALR